MLIKPKRELNETANQFLKECKERSNHRTTYKYKVTPLSMSEVCKCSHSRFKHMLGKSFCTSKNCTCKKFTPCTTESYKKYLKRIITSESKQFYNKW